MEKLRNDPIVQSMLDTGYPPWAQEMIEEVIPTAEEKEHELPESCMDVLWQLFFGKKNAVSRTELSIRTGFSDRVVRRSIEILRRDFIILNDQDGKGYYRSDDVQEIRRAYYQELGRALAILKRLKPMRRFLRMRGAL